MALIALAGAISIGLSLLGAYGPIVNVGGRHPRGTLLYTALMRRREAPSLSRPGIAAEKAR